MHLLVTQELLCHGPCTAFTPVDNAESLSKVTESTHAPFCCQQLVLLSVLMLAVLMNVYGSPPQFCFAFFNMVRSNTHHLYAHWIPVYLSLRTACSVLLIPSLGSLLIFYNSQDILVCKPPLYICHKTLPLFS